MTEAGGDDPQSDEEPAEAVGGTAHRALPDAARPRRRRTDDDMMGS
jgi:hypothetical protein